MASFNNPFSDIFSDPTESVSATSGDEGHTFTIEEHDVPNARRIVLRDRALPYRGVEWGGEQRVKRTNYPGNPVASQQVLGPVEGLTSINGMWKDRFMAGAVEISSVGGTGAASAIAAAAQGAANQVLGAEIILAENLVRIFHGIRRAGTSVRVQYLGEVRTGIIASFVARYERQQDIAWTMDFDWRSWDDDQPLRSATEPVDKASILSDLNALLDVVAQAPYAVERFAAQLSTAIDDIASITQVLFDALRTIDALTDLPGTVLGNALGTLRQLVGQLTDLIRRIGDVRWPTISSSSSLAGPTVDPVSSKRSASSATKQSLEFERWRRSVVLAASQLRRQSSDAVDQRVRQRVPPTTRVVTLRQGASLYDISNRFYGSPDFVNYLAAVNKLTSVSVAAGTRLRVPPRATGPATVSLSRGGSRGCSKGC